MTYTPLLAAAIVFALGINPAAHAVESPSEQDRLTQQPHSTLSDGSARESTKKERNPAKDHKTDQTAQVTLGGAKPFVSGEIARIEGDYYFIKDDEGGDELRLLMNKDANLDCSAAPMPIGDANAPSVKADRQPAETADMSARQKEQGQKQDETAVGSGFAIGTCSFKPGDRIKAEVDDMGRVTMLKLTIMPEKPQMTRSLAEHPVAGELAIPGKQENPAQLDMTGPQGNPPKAYSILPVPTGELKTVTDSPLLHSAVTNTENQAIGSIDSLLMDSQTGHIEYAVVLLDDAKRLEAVPWTHMKQRSQKDKPEFMLDTKHFQLSPSLNESNDRSLEVAKLLKQRRASLRAESRNPQPEKIEVVMQEGTFQVKGHSIPGAMTAIVLRNQDTVMHGFSSPMLKDKIIRTEGDVIEVKKNGGRVYHVPAGKTATLYFTPGSHQDPSTGIRETVQYAFVDDLHPNVKGEFLVVETTGETGGG